MKWIMTLQRKEDYPGPPRRLYEVDDDEVERIRKVEFDGKDYIRPPALDLTIGYTGAKRLLIGIQHCHRRLKEFVEEEDGHLSLKEVIIEAEVWWRFYYYGRLIIKYEIKGDERVLEELEQDYDKYNPREEPHKSVIHAALVKCGELKE